MTVVGEAEIIAHLNTTSFKRELQTLERDSSTLGSSGGLAGGQLGKDAEKEGEKLGQQTGKGMEKGLRGKMSGGLSSLLGGLGAPEFMTNPEVLGAAAVGGAVAGLVDLGMKMQEADAQIATSAGISIKAATDIGNAFLNTAGQTEFSGREQAQAFAAVAGQLKATEGQALSTTQAVQVMNAAGDLATAKQIDLGTATQALAGIMQAFQLPTQAAASATDVLFTASNATGQTVDQLAQGLEKLKSKMGSMAPPLGDLAALMVQMTKEGITGRAAISGVNTAMTGLMGAATGTSKSNTKARDELASLGIAAVDAHGHLTSLVTIIEKLAPIYAGMTQAQQLQTSATIFGSAAARQMTAVIDGGAKSFEKTTKDVNASGAAHKAAVVQSHTLGVEWKTLKATADDFGTQLGQKLIPIAQQFLQVATALVPVLGTLLKGALFILTPLVTLLDDAIKSLVGSFSAVINWVKANWNKIGPEIAKPFEELPKLWNQFYNDVVGAFYRVLHFIENIWDEVRHETAHLIDDVVNFFIDLPMRVIHVIEHAAGSVLKAFEKWIPGGGLIGGAISGIAHLFGEGGVVNKPTLGIIGEKGPEAVIPLNRFGVGTSEPAVRDLVRGSSSTAPATQTGNGVHVHITTVANNPHEIASEISWLVRTGQLSAA